MILLSLPKSRTDPKQPDILSPSFILKLNGSEDAVPKIGSFLSFVAIVS